MDLESATNTCYCCHSTQPLSNLDWCDECNCPICLKNETCIGACRCETISDSLGFDNHKVTAPSLATVLSNETMSYVKDAEGRLLSYDPAFGKRFDARPGYTTRELAISEKTMAQCEAIDAEVLATGKQVERVIELPQRDGTVEYWLNSKFPIETQRGKRCIGGRMTNITQYVQGTAAMAALALMLLVVPHGLHKRRKDDVTHLDFPPATCANIA